MKNLFEILSLATGIIGVILAIYFYRKTRIVKHIEIIVHERIPLLRQNDDVKGRLIITYDGQKLKNPIVHKLSFANTGNTPISINDFISDGLIIKLPEEVRCVDSQLLSGNDNVESIEIMSSNSIKIRPNALNIGNAFSIMLVVDGTTKNGISISGKILGGNYHISHNEDTSIMRELLGNMLRVLLIAIPVSSIVYFTMAGIIRSFSKFGSNMNALTITTSATMAVLVGVAVILSRLVLNARRKAKELDKGLRPEL